MRPRSAACCLSFANTSACPAGDLFEEGLRVKGADAPRLQVLRHEVASVEGYDDRSLTVGGGGDYVAVLFIVRHTRNQRLVTADPGIAEVVAQFPFEMKRSETGATSASVPRRGSPRG